MLLYNYINQKTKEDKMKHTTKTLGDWNYISIEGIEHEIAFEINDDEYNIFIMELNDCTSINDVRLLCNKWDILI